MVFCSGDTVLGVVPFFLPPEALSKKARKAPVCSELQHGEGREEKGMRVMRQQQQGSHPARGAGPQQAALILTF